MKNAPERLVVFLRKLRTGGAFTAALQAAYPAAESAAVATQAFADDLAGLLILAEPEIRWRESDISRSQSEEDRQEALKAVRRFPRTLPLFVALPAKVVFVMLGPQP